MKDVRRVAGTRLSASVPYEDVELVRVELRTQAAVLDALRISQDKHAHEMREGFSTVDDRLRAQHRSLEALHQTQVQQGQEMREGFTTVNLGMAQMTALLTIAIKKDGD